MRMGRVYDAHRTGQIYRAHANTQRRRYIYVNNN
jgi:hypothetical protein